MAKPTAISGGAQRFARAAPWAFSVAQAGSQALPTAKA